MSDIRDLPYFEFTQCVGYLGRICYQVKRNGIYVGRLEVDNVEEAEKMVIQLERLKMIVRDAVYDEIKGMEKFIGDSK